MEPVLLAAALLAGFCTALIAAAVAHGALRPLLEGRGVKPWRLRDTFASTPLILVGSGGVGAAVSVLSLLITGTTPELAPHSATIIASTLGVGLVSAACLLLGILALRKLS